MKLSTEQRSLVLVALGTLAVALVGRTMLNVLFPPWNVLFHILPLLATVLLIMAAPAGTERGRFYRGVTLMMLFVAILLGELSICLLIAAPLVYSIAGLGWVTYSRIGRRRYQSATLIAAVLVSSFAAGTTPTQLSTATADVVVASTTQEVATRLAGTPNMAPLDHGFIASRLPQIIGVEGEGTEIGDLRTIQFSDGGTLIMRVAASTAGSVRFQTVSDTTTIGGWIRWDAATFRVVSTDDGTSVALELSYELLLEPAWYFSHFVNAGMDDAAAYLLTRLVDDG